MSDAQQLSHGQWVEATEIPYCSCFKERLFHLFGRHIFYGHPTCLICGQAYQKEGDSKNASMP